MAGDPGVEYPRETIEGSDFEINSLIRLFIRQLKTDSSQFGQIFSQTNFWSKYSYFFMKWNDVEKRVIQFYYSYIMQYVVWYI